MSRFDANLCESISRGDFLNKDYYYWLSYIEGAIMNAAEHEMKCVTIVHEDHITDWQRFALKNELVDLGFSVYADRYKIKVRWAE